MQNLRPYFKPKEIRVGTTNQLTNLEFSFAYTHKPNLEIEFANSISEIVMYTSVLAWKIH